MLGKNWEHFLALVAVFLAGGLILTNHAFAKTATSTADRAGIIKALEE